MKTKEELAQYEWNDFGIFVDHNYPCPTCRVNVAVWHMNRGIFEPCWGCQKNTGFYVIRLNKFFNFIFRWWTYK